MDKQYAQIAAAAIGLLLFQPAQAAVFADWAPAEQEVFNLVNLQRGFQLLDPLNADSRLHQAAEGHSADMSANNFFSHTGSNGSSFDQRILAAGYHWNQSGGSSGENIAAGYGTSFNGSSAITLAPAADAAREVMYGTAKLTELSNFSVSKGNQAFGSWAEVGNGWNNALWDSWHTYKANSGGWMGSAGHRDNILNGAFTDLGVGLVFDPNDQAFSNGNGPFHTYWTQSFAAGDSTSPVPLPSAVWLFSSALTLLFARRKRLA